MHSLLISVYKVLVFSRGAGVGTDINLSTSGNIAFPDEEGFKRFLQISEFDNSNLITTSEAG